MFVGILLGLGVVVLKLFDILKDKNVWDVFLWVLFFIMFVIFGVFVFGIVYGSLFINLDFIKINFFFGFEEVKENWVEMWKED